MRLLFVVTLAFAAFLAAADVSALNDAPSKRLLRATVRVDEEEERGVWDSLSNKVTKLFTKPEPWAIAIKTMDDRKVAKVLKTSLLKQFKSVDPKKFETVDDLFNSKAFKGLENYVARLNRQNTDKQTSMAKVFSTGLGDKHAFHVFFAATGSSNRSVRKSGRNLQDQLLTQWAKEGKTWDEVVKNVPEGLPATYYSYLKQYFGTFINLIHDSQAKRSRLAKAAAKAKARAAANAAA